MSFHEQTDRLERSFRTTCELLRALLQGLQQRRASWASARPSTIEPSAEMETIAQQLAGEENTRTLLLAEIRKVMPAPIGGTSADLHLNVTRIAAAMPAPAAKTLRAAADEATALAKSVRVEVTLGQRLLRFGQRAHESVLQQLGAAAAPPSGASLYDRNARSARGLGAPRRQGVLIDGRM